MPPFFNSFKNSHLNCNFPANCAGTAHCGFNSYFLITEAEHFLHPFIGHSLNIVHGLSGVTSLAETDEIKMYTYDVCPFPFQTVDKNVINQKIYRLWICVMKETPIRHLYAVFPSLCDSILIFPIQL